MSGANRHVEGEITSESSAFPRANYEYTSMVEFSHWYSVTGSMGTTWYWDPSSGYLTQTAQISARGCLVCDKWDAVQGLADDPTGTTYYPSRSAPAGASVIDGEGSLDEGAVSADAAAPDSPTYKVTSSDGQATLAPDLAAGRRAYRDQAAAAAEAIAAEGPSRGIITFARPVSAADLDDLADDGVVIESIEAVTTNEHGDRWTFGSPWDNTMSAWLKQSARDVGERLLGITSAQVVVDSAALRKAQERDSVYLVDLSLEHFGRSHPKEQDIVMNDLYWTIAGWE